MPTSSISSTLLRDLGAIVGPAGLVVDPVALAVYENDAYTLERCRPGCVVLPRSTDEVARVVRRLFEARVPFVPRGAGTGLSGGTLALHGEVMIALNRMNRILEVDPANRVAVVECGVINRDLSIRCAPLGLHYAPDPSSQSACTLGGNVAENSGGPHCLKYGVTTNHVLGVKLVTTEGEVLDLGGKAEGGPGYDLLGVLVGSEGTFGVVTEITVRLTRLPPALRTVLATFLRVEDASRTVSEVIGRGLVPAALELMDRLAIRAVESGHYRIGHPPEVEAVLLAEVDGLEAGLEEEAEAIAAICRAHDVLEVRVARTPEERTLWWNNRKTAFGATGFLAPDSYVQDGVIPRSRLTEVLGEIGRIAEAHGIQIANVFHAGDGNLHPLLCYDRDEPGQVERVVRAGSEILAACVRAGGSITGEHGVGAEKQCDIALMYSPAELEWQKRVRAAFDPHELANPGKVFPTPGRCAEGRPLTAETLARGGAPRSID